MTPRSDAHWLDARRQQRKTRLRQKARGEVVSPEVEINTLLPEDAVEGPLGALKWDFPAMVTISDKGYLMDNLGMGYDGFEIFGAWVLDGIG